MDDRVLNHKCPACNGTLRFDGVSGKVVCDFCGSAYTAEEIEALHAEAEKKAREADEDADFAIDGDLPEDNGAWDTSGIPAWENEDGMRTYTCATCGAELICEETTAATFCPFCGNATVIPSRLSGGLKPNYVIPFKLDEHAAKDALLRYYKGQKFLPDAFRAQNKIDELKGIYVPFWLFDGEADADAVFDARDTRMYRSGDYEITEVRHYVARRSGTVPFEKIPVDASSKMSDEHMDAIEPFDYSALVPFSTAYLPGFLADKYDVTAEDSATRADARAAHTAISIMQDDVRGYDIVTLRDKRVVLHRGDVKYALLPVYMLTTRWKDTSYLFAMNGQSGKLIGNLPIDRRKYWTWFFGIFASVTAVLGTLLLLVV